MFLLSEETKKEGKNVFPDSIYLFKVNNGNTRKRCEIRLKLTIKIPARRQRSYC